MNSRIGIEEKALPDGWRMSSLADACTVITSPVDKKTVEGELPVKLCNYTDVYYNNSIDSRIDFMTATAKPKEVEKFSIVKDDVIITKDSETPDDIGVPSHVKETINNLLCGYHLTILRPKKKVSGKYVCYALTSRRVRHDFYRFANGITRFGLTNESYQKIRVPIPSFPEQKAIASLLETWDTAIEKTEALIAAKEKRFKWSLKTLISDQQDNPKWRRVKLGEIGAISSAGVDKKIIEGQRPVRLVNYLDVLNKDFLSSDGLNHWVSAPDRKIVQCSVKKGDVFFTPSSEIQGDIAHSAVALEDIDKAVYSYHVVRFRPKENWDLLFRGYVFKSSHFYHQAYRLCEGSGQRYVISQTYFRNMTICFPHEREQHRIGQILHTAQKEIELIQAIVEQYRTQKRGLMQKLLTGNWRVNDASQNI